MKWERIAGLSRRVMLQIIRDKRTFFLLIVIPILLLILADLLFESGVEEYQIGVVNGDNGLVLPNGSKISLAEEIEKGIDEEAVFSLVVIDESDVESALDTSSVKAVLVMPDTFTSDFVQSRALELDVRLEGSNPALIGTILGRLNQVAAGALLRLGAGTPLSAAFAGVGDGDLPVSISPIYHYGGAEFGPMDYIAPVYIAFLVLFFVFLITCVSIIQERTHGTMERLLATPVSRVEIIAGYILGLGVYALMQGALILLFALFVLKIVYAGSLWLLFLVIVLLSIVGVSLGMLASSFARNEFQVVQYIPLLIIPQMLIGGTFVPVEDLPRILQPLAYCMPLTYANIALRDVMIKGWGLADIYKNVLVLAGFAGFFILLDILAVRRKID